MTHAEFVHLRVRSAYSLLDGALHAPDIVDLAKAENMPALAVVDNRNLFGALEFAMKAVGSGIQPITGVILPISRDQSEISASQRRPPADDLVLLAQNQTGYGNLMKLVSNSFLSSAAEYEPEIELDKLEGHTDGMIALTGGPGGAIDRLVNENQIDHARKRLEQLKTLFPDRLYVEIQRLGLPGESDVELKLIDLAYTLNLPIVGTNDVRFGSADMHEAHDALLAIADGRRLEDTDRRRSSENYRFKSAAEMISLFSDIPEAITNTLVIAQRCAVMPEPRDPILPGFETEAGRNEAEELKAQAQKGLTARLDSMEIDEEKRAVYQERLTYELGVIIQMGFPGYFLIVAEFIQWAKAAGIPVGPGRGSGAGSVVAWALTITDLDPLQFDLLFERFLNPERVSMPDFDIDFCQERRDEVIAHVQQKYGRDKVAQIITFGKLQARAVLRDVGRVLGMPYGQVDRICKLVPNNPANPVTLGQAINGEPALQEMRRTDEQVSTLINIALKLEGLYRNTSTHAAGVVIGDRPLDELVALYRDPRSDMPVTQFNMKSVETAGLVKFDFLGLKTLTVITDAVKLLQDRGITLNIDSIPLDDKNSFDLMASGNTAGVFQLEGSGMRDMLKRLKPNRFEDIIAVVALYRPGPMDNIPSYIARKHGAEPVTYPHPILQPILEETYGIIIYQEQVMQIAQVLSGYSLGGADLLRRAMGKKIKTEMAAQREIFVNGAVERGVDETKASEIFDLVDKFAGYGFNKSHAAAYALVAYQTAYLKANHPVEFIAASMTHDMHNTDKLGLFRRELDRLGSPLLPPDVNASHPMFTVEKDKENKLGVRYALGAIRNVGRPAALALEDARADGPFKNLADLSARLDAGRVNKRQIEALARAGAFDQLEANRARVFGGAEAIARAAQAAAEDRTSNQSNLFGEREAAPFLRLPEISAWSDAEQLSNELEAIGMYLSAHPLDAYQTHMKRLGVTNIADLLKNGPPPSTRRNQEYGNYNRGAEANCRIAATQLSRQERTSSRGSRYAFIQLSDATGVIEATAFSEVLSTSRDLLDSGRPLLLGVDARLGDSGLRVGISSVRDLEEAVADAGRELVVHVEGSVAFDSISTILKGEKPGRATVRLLLEVDPTREISVELKRKIALSPATAQAMKSLPGVIDARME
jgi:DNA polymerase-3 subunit alpha